MFVVQILVTKMFVRVKVRMEKVRMQMFVRKCSYANIHQR